MYCLDSDVGYVAPNGYSYSWDDQFCDNIPYQSGGGGPGNPDPNGPGTNASGPGRIPQPIYGPTGTTVYPDKLSAILNSILSGTAIVFGRDAVPTTVSATKYNQQRGVGTTGIDPQTLALIAAQNRGLGSGSTGANVESFIKNNTGLLLIAGAMLVLYKMNPKK